MSIRLWNEKDIPEIVILLKQLSKDLGEKVNIKEESAYLNFWKMRNTDYYQSFVNIEDLHVVGFISLIFYRAVFHQNETVLINELVVHEKYRNKDIGEKQLKKAIEQTLSRNMGKIEVRVLKENVNTIRFYKRNGFDKEYYLLGKEFI